MNKVFVVAPHMDDEVLGVGGTILKHLDAGDRVKVCFLCHRKYGNRFDSAKNEVEVRHSLAAKAILDYQEVVHLNLEDERLDDAVHKIIEPLQKEAAEFDPDITYIPFIDNNQDHRAAFEACIVVFRPFASNYKSLMTYEVLSSTDQSPPIQPFLFSPNYYVDISPFLERKIEAMELYETERREWPHPRSPEAVNVMAKKRGMEVNLNAAEAFMILRQRW
tara:strand:+ start:1922 stop:2581 length:660 start_codon:yes stop_codon:yes gene_type:complete